MLLALATVTLSGCATSVGTRSTAFYEPSYVPEGSIAVVANPSLDADSIQFSNYRATIEQKLQLAGYQLADSPGSAEFIAELNYGIDDGSSKLVPYYGNPNGQVSTVSRTIYKRVLTLDIFQQGNRENTSSPRKVLELKAVSSGSCGDIAPVFDEIVEVAFKDFPSENGQAHTGKIVMEGDC